MAERGQFFRSKEPKDKHRINNQISAPRVRLIGPVGEQVGVVSFKDAITMADEAGMDLVEVAPEAEPPVCKILDYGKLRYREQKKAAETRKKSAPKEIKELRIRYSTDKHDIETKVRYARGFIEEGDRVRFDMRFRGREAVYYELGLETLKRVAEALQDVALVEEISRGLVNQRLFMLLVPKVQAAKPAK